MNQPLKLIEGEIQKGVSCFSSLYLRLSCTYCYLLQDTFKEFITNRPKRHAGALR